MSAAALILLNDVIRAEEERARRARQTVCEACGDAMADCDYPEGTGEYHLWRCSICGFKQEDY